MYFWAGAIIFFVTLGVIIIRPRHISEAVAAAAGAALMVLLGYVRPANALQAITSQWNLYGFFLGLMIVSAIAEEAGVFEMLAGLAARWARGSSLRLYLAVFAIGSFITAFLTNDATGASEGLQGRPQIGPASVGHTARFVLDHAPCNVLFLRPATG